MAGQGKKGRGIMAVIRQTSAGQAPPASPAASELMLRLEEKSKEAAKLKKLLAQAQKEMEDQSKQPTLFSAGAPRPEDTAMEIEALRAKAVEQDRKGNLLDAFHLYRRIIRIDSEDIGALYEIAALYYSAGLIAKAVETLRVILELDPGQERAAESLGELGKEL